MAGVSEATVERVAPRFVVRAFSTELGEGLGMGAIQVIAMDQSVMVWVGENAGGDLPPMGLSSSRSPRVSRACLSRPP